MSGLNVRSAFGKLQDILFSKDLRKEQFVTGQRVGNSRRALDTVSLSVYLVAEDVVEAGSTNNLVKLTSHAAKEGDFLQIKTSANSVKEFEVSIDEVVDADHVRLGCILSASLEAGDTVSILRPITPRMSSTGASLATVESAPLSFTKDAVKTEVTEDTVDPNNNQPLPVKLMGLSGPVTLNADQINIQTSHTGANPDSMRVGDGTTEWGIEAVTKKGLVKDETAIASLDAILADLQNKADLSETQPVSAASLPLPTGAATEVTVEASRVLLNTISGKDFATQTTLAAILADLQSKADLSETQPVSASSLPLPTGAATEVTVEASRVLLNTISGKDFATQTTLALMKIALDGLLTGKGTIADAAVSNPASSGSTIALLKGILTLITSTNTKLDALETAVTPALDSSLTQTVTSGATSTFTPPVGARLMQISNNAADTANPIRWTPSAETPTASNGSVLIPTAPALLIPAGEIKVIGVGGSADVTVSWFV